MRYYPKDTKVLANCGTRKEPEWIPGIVLERLFNLRSGEDRHYVELERNDSDGKNKYWFSLSYLMEDNPRNRKRKGVAS